VKSKGMPERISEATLYRYKQAYDGLLPSEVKKLRSSSGEGTAAQRGYTLIGPK
jgi:hypothetical protein